MDNVFHPRLVGPRVSRRFESRRRQRHVCVSPTVLWPWIFIAVPLLKCGRLVVTLYDHFTPLLTRFGALFTFVFKLPFRLHLPVPSPDRSSCEQLYYFLEMLTLTFVGGKIGYKVAYFCIFPNSMVRSRSWEGIVAHLSKSQHFICCPNARLNPSRHVFAAGI